MKTEYSFRCICTVSGLFVDIFVCKMQATDQSLGWKWNVDELSNLAARPQQFMVLYLQQYEN